MTIEIGTNLTGVLTLVALAWAFVRMGRIIILEE